MFKSGVGLYYTIDWLTCIGTHNQQSMTYTMGDYRLGGRNQQDNTNKASLDKRHLQEGKPVNRSHCKHWSMYKAEAYLCIIQSTTSDS